MPATETPPFGLLDRATLKAKLDHKAPFQLWNTLNAEDYKPEINIPGSKWIPADSLTAQLAAGLAGKDEVLVVYCGGGQCVASMQAAEKLVSWGYTNVFTYEGGLKDWTAGGLPTVNLGTNEGKEINMTTTATTVPTVPAATKFSMIDRDALKAKMDKKETFQLWNVLTTQYYKAEANIPGSKWIPVDTLTEKLANDNAKKDEVIVTYCGGLKCPSSKQAAEKLVSLGYTNVFAFEGGLESWTEAKLPLVKL